MIVDPQADGGLVVRLSADDLRCDVGHVTDRVKEALYQHVARRDLREFEVKRDTLAAALLTFTSGPVRDHIEAGVKQAERHIERLRLCIDAAGQPNLTGY